MSIRKDDFVLAPFQRFLEALLKKLLGKTHESVALEKSADAEAVFGMPTGVLDAMDVPSVGRVLSDPRFLEVYAAVVANRGNYVRAAAVIDLAIAAKHGEPTRLRELAAALRSIP